MCLSLYVILALLKVICFFDVNSQTEKFTLFHQNIAGILSKIELLELALVEISNDFGEVDFICLSETFIKSGAERNLKLSTHTLAAYFSRAHHRRGGTCILVRRGLEYSVL